MDKELQDAINQAHQFVVYLESEQADLKDDEFSFDALWQSIYDVCQLVKFGIIEDISDEEYQEAYQWLKDNQHYSEIYKDKVIEI